MSSAPMPTIKDIQQISTPGSWQTKSGGILELITRIDYDLLGKFLTYDPAELNTLPEDIRGLRMYRVKSIPTGSLGANEWHKIRNEIFTVLRGSVRWTCTDLEGNTEAFIVTASQSIFTPHHILHTYEALEDETELAVLANTLFNPDNPATHDTYSAELFHKLQSSTSENSKLLLR